MLDCSATDQTPTQLSHVSVCVFQILVSGGCALSTKWRIVHEHVAQGKMVSGWLQARLSSAWLQPTLTVSHRLRRHRMGFAARDLSGLRCIVINVSMALDRELRLMPVRRHCR